MPAFSFNYQYHINQNIRMLYQRRLAISALTLTHEEYVQTFVPTEARDLFRNIAPFNGSTGYVSGDLDLGQFTGDKHLKGTLWIRGDIKSAPPLVKGLERQPDAPEQVAQRIKTWLENGGDVHCEFGRVNSLFNKLNTTLSRGAMRHYWPTIMALCDSNELTQPLVQELQNTKSTTSAVLPPGLIQACRRTAQTVTGARLIDPNVKTPEMGEITLRVQTSQKYIEAGLGEFWGLS